MAGPALSFRELIDLIEAAQAWGISQSPIFTASLDAMLRVFPDLREKLKKFIDVKLSNPLTARYGKHDRPMTGPLVGFWHCHLRDDAILIYNLKNRCINLVLMTTHGEIEGKRQKHTLARIEPYLAR